MSASDVCGGASRWASHNRWRRDDDGGFDLDGGISGQEGRTLEEALNASSAFPGRDSIGSTRELSKADNAIGRCVAVR